MSPVDFLRWRKWRGQPIRSTHGVRSEGPEPAFRTGGRGVRISSLRQRVGRTSHARVFIPSRARGTDTLVRHEPRVSAGDCIIRCAKRGSHARADRKRHAMCPTRQRPILYKRRRIPPGRLGAARGRVLLCKLIVKTCPQITVNGPVSATPSLAPASVPRLAAVEAPGSGRPPGPELVQPTRRMRLGTCSSNTTPIILFPAVGSWQNRRIRADAMG
jgi:hypothetical protein